MSQPTNDAAGPGGRCAANLARFHRVVARLRAGDDDDAWLAEGLADLHARGALDAALHLPAHCARPGAPPSQKTRLRERNIALLRWAETVRARSVRERARAMATALSAYHATESFRQHFAAGERPADRHGFLYDVLRHGPPIAANTIKTILLKRNGSRAGTSLIPMIQFRAQAGHK